MATRRLEGRDLELTSLAELVEDAAAYRGRVALITGEPGIGKTTLAEAVEALARGSNFVAAWGRCSSADMPSYWPWTQVLNTLFQTADLLHPGKFESRPEMFAALAEAVEARSQARPVLVIFEDAHWADADSLRLLELLAEVAAGQRLLLLITSRVDEGTLPATAGVRRFPLSGLDRDATAALVRRIVSTEPSREYLDEVHRRSAGNPFFVAEVARLQASRGTATGSVPVAVRQVLEHRLARLPQDSVELLQVSSVVGVPHVGRLAAVTGITEVEVVALLEEPAAAGVVRDGRFTHELMRETLYDGIDPIRRGALHRRAAERLQAEGPAQLARHWALASGADARARAGPLAVDAGDLAAAGLAHQQAVEHYRLALEMGVREPSVHRRLGEAQMLAGQVSAGRATLRSVAQKARAAEDAGELGAAVLAMGGGVGGFEVDMFDVDQAPWLQDTLRLLPVRDSALRAAVLARLALVRAGSASADERARVAEEAAAMGRRVGDADAETAALAALCDVRSGPDFVQQRIAAAERMLALAGRHGLLELLARRLRLRARLELGDLIGVDADLAAYARVADRLRSPTYGWLVPMWRGMRAVLDGDLDGGQRFAGQVAALAEKLQSANAEMMAWALRWRIARLRKDVATIRKLPARMSRWTEDFPAWSCTYALLYAEVGDHERGRRHIRRVMGAGLDTVPFDSEWIELLWSLGEAAVLLDERDAVSAVNDALAPYADLWAVDGFGAACFGKVADLLSRLDEYLGRRTAEPVDQASFVRTGNIWRLAFRGLAVSVVDSKGMRDLAVLLARPGREIHVLDLVEASGGPTRAEAGIDTGPIIDATARDAYRRRLAELENEIAAAAENSDLGQFATLEAERKFLSNEIAVATGLRGRPRMSGDRVEKARKAVAMRIGTALKAIERQHPELARHLRISTSTGRACCYRPEQQVVWQLTARHDVATPDVAPPG